VKGSVVIIDYGSGNLRSAAKAFERAAFENAHDVRVIVSNKPEDIKNAERIVLPGVGAFADCKKGLSHIPGMIDALKEAVEAKAKPFFGICVGMQLMASKGLEHGETEGLGWIPGSVVRIKPEDAALKIPHMGWNTLEMLQPHPLFENIKTGEEGLHAYFVHSYHLDATVAEQRIAVSHYGAPLTAVVARDNLFGTQFHPEKSQTLGLALISNFLKWRP
jgi:glutamine amidotransferase